MKFHPSLLALFERSPVDPFVFFVFFVVNPFCWLFK